MRAVTTRTAYGPMQIEALTQSTVHESVFVWAVMTTEHSVSASASLISHVHTRRLPFSHRGSRRVDSEPSPPLEQFEF